MRREPPITLRGALQLLGHYERPWIDRLDRLLGGVILAAGIGALVPPLATLAPIFGWVDQKNEAAGLLRQGLERVWSRVSGVQGYERVELMTAAHTIIVISAVFEVFRDGIPSHLRPEVLPTEEEQQMLITGRWRQPADDLLTSLYQAEVPVPGGVRGLLENRAEIRQWARLLFRHLQSFLAGLDGYEASAADLDTAALADQAVLRYESHFLTLAGGVPDFAIWSQLSEHAATRATAGRSTAALGRLEEMLTALTVGRPDRDTLSLANRAVLTLPVVRWRSGTGEVVFPTIEDSYVNPRYRLAVAGGSARPADETWWTGQPMYDQRLAARVQRSQVCTAPGRFPCRTAIADRRSSVPPGALLHRRRQLAGRDGQLADSGGGANIGRVHRILLGRPSCRHH